MSSGSRPSTPKSSIPSSKGMASKLSGAGEFTEIWKFRDLQDYERKWKALMSDPKVQKIFETTGPMVKGESLKLTESVAFLDAP